MKSLIRRPYVIALALELMVGGIIMLGLAVAHSKGQDVYSLYSDKFRSSLFTGFLTASSFLFALQTFIVIRMKENVYDSKVYKDRFRRVTGNASLAGIYRPLEGLSSVISGAILAALTTSASQLTIGLFESWFTAAFCFALAGATLGFLFFALWEVRANFAEWFRCLEETRAEENGPVRPDARRVIEAIASGKATAEDAEENE